MSDIQAQAKRDAEFDRLLAELMNEKYVDYTAWDMRQAYEMGKRHGREEDDAEYDVVICDSLRCRDGSRMPGFEAVNIWCRLFHRKWHYADYDGRHIVSNSGTFRAMGCRKCSHGWYAKVQP